ncbi:hypothetical protein RJ639_034271 [Escallonia herrerae]|uniref:Uncharacterized protein n=1 Tax=Escallonia herrerae TaxID=1293975 RepID=A0AA89BB15_9ASTE|nr:hypothetical protein RJ639_034271 [Escallonia herrerae]
MIKQRQTELSQKRATPKPDILSQMLLSTDDNGRFSNEVDIASYLVGLLHAGYSTVNAALTFVMKYLAEHADVSDEVLRVFVDGLCACVLVTKYYCSKRVKEWI